MTIGCTGFMLALAAAGVVGRLAEFRRSGGWLELALAALAGAAFVFFCVVLVSGIRDSLVARIVPYFDTRLGLEGLGPFSRGAAVARHCKELDALAAQGGIRTIWSFLDREWHPCAAGLEAIAALLQLSLDLPDRGEIVKDLEAIESALAEGARQGRSFYFVLREGRDKFISPMEMDQRKGSFW